MRHLQNLRLSCVLACLSLSQACFDSNRSNEAGGSRSNPEAKDPGPQVDSNIRTPSQESGSLSHSNAASGDVNAWAERHSVGDADRSELALANPTEEQLMNLQIYLAGQRLGRVTGTADIYRLGYHAGLQFTNPDDIELEGKFFTALWSGDYARIEELTGLFQARLGAGPPDPLVLARLGFLSVWKFAERYRLLNAPGPFPPEAQGQLWQALGGCAQYFDNAAALAPNHAVFKGFSADCNLLLGQGPNGSAKTLQGLTTAAESIRRSAPFNLFTIGYALTFLAPETPQFKLGLEMMFRNLDLCFEAKISRDKPEVASFMKSFRNDGQKPFCLNSDKAPHNFEGFFMILGDLLLKAGKESAAKIAYANAKLLPTYNSWPLKAKLEARLASTAELMPAFQAPVDPMAKPGYPTITFNTEYACMVCHQKK